MDLAAFFITIHINISNCLEINNDNTRTADVQVVFNILEYDGIIHSLRMQRLIVLGVGSLVERMSAPAYLLTRLILVSVILLIWKFAIAGLYPFAAGLILVLLAYTYLVWDELSIEEQRFSPPQ
jgi:hypothetical protein